MKIWLDDVRPLPDDTWTPAKNYVEAIRLLTENDVDDMSFDHDLGICGDCITATLPCDCTCHLTGHDVILWIEEHNKWPKQRPTCHSSNPPGRQRIEAAISRHYDGEQA